MGWFKSMFINQVKDERITNTRNRLYKETYILIMSLCILSLVVKYIYYGPSISNVATELILLTLSSIYFSFRSIQLGVYSDEVEIHDRSSKYPMNIKKLIAGSLFGIFIATFFGIRSAVLYADSGLQTLWYFILVFSVSLIIYVPVFILFLITTHELANSASKKANSKHSEE